MGYRVPTATYAGRPYRTDPKRRAKLSIAGMCLLRVNRRHNMPAKYNLIIGGVDLACGHNVALDEPPRCLAFGCGNKPCEQCAALGKVPSCERQDCPYRPGWGNMPLT